YSDDEVVAADHLASCIMTPIEMDVWASIKNIKDPEYPMWTLSQLRICYPTGVCVKDDTMMIEFTPTVEHCSLATLIGL
ncbi:Protein FAM96B, putative, partial [Perkinsus marinus ATCC 50983]